MPKHLAQLGLEAIPSAATVGGEKALELGRRGARSAKVVSRLFALQELKMEWYVRPKAGGNMLLGLDPLLTPDLLHALAAMGHGDRIVLVDANYPATRGRRLILLPGVDTPRALQAVLSVLPIVTGYNVQSANPVVVG